MAGLILGALAGAGGQMADFADKQIGQDQALERLNVESDLATQRAKALEEFKLDLSNQQRTQMVARVDTAAGQIADQRLAPKIAQEQAGITDPDAWTPEQQAAVDQSNTMDRQGIIAQAKADGSAGLASGDITPEHAMANTSKLEINQLKMQSLLDRANDRNATMKEVADVRAEAMRYGYELRLQAAQERRISGKIDTATGRMLITSEDANIKASTNQMQMLSRELENVPRQVGGKPNPRIDDINQQIDGLREDIKTSQTNKASYLKSMGLMGDSAAPSAAPAGKPDSAVAAPAPAVAASAVPNGLPAGSVQIGTSGGKPVYRSPDGKKWKLQ